MYDSVAVEKESKSRAVANVVGQKKKEGDLKRQSLSIDQRSSKANYHKISQGIQKKKNGPGLPYDLRFGVESLSGYRMDDVKVHYHSDKPSQLRAHAYAQGNSIHLGDGQERHLPHEAWHIVQQKQNRVKPAQKTDVDGINNDSALENEADLMGRKAARFGRNSIDLRSPAYSRIAVGWTPHLTIQCETGDRPFENAYSPLINSSKWFPTAKAYEQRLGTYSYGHTKSDNALTSGINKLHTVIRTYYEDTHNYEDVLRTAFFKDERSSAGQVGLDLDVTAMLDVINNGNLRERMTAFYNAAYFAGGYGDNIKEGFKQILHDIIFNSDTDKADDLELDRTALEEQISYYNSWTSGKGLTGSIAESLLGVLSSERLPEFMRMEDKSYLFSKDVFALGNLSLQSSVSDLIEIANSQKARTKREDTEQERLSNTPEDYERMGVPLSDREMAYAFPDVDRSIWNLFRFWQSDAEIRREDYQTEKLPWREGGTYYTISPDNSWYKKFHDQLRMPVVAGVSGTTTRMLTAYKFLNAGSPLVDFRLAILGWMLTSWDHSLYEILRGSHMAGLKPEGEEERLRDIIRMYMTVAPLDTQELRANVARNKMFPHEEIYVDLAKERDQTQEHLKAPTPDIADAAETALDTAETNDTTGETTNISKAHAIAIRGYTSGMHSLLNTVMSCMSLPDIVGKKLVKRKLSAVVDACQAGNPVEWIPVLDPKKTEIRALNGLATDEQSRARSEINTWLGQLVDNIYPELKLHANMTVEGMSNLPSVNGVTVYRGDWKSGIGSMYKVGKEITSKTFASYSRDRNTAIAFANHYESKWTSWPVIIELDLSGKAGKDVSNLSIYDEDEVLLMPGAKIKLGSSSTETIRGKDMEVFEGSEV